MLKLSLEMTQYGRQRCSLQGLGAIFLMRPSAALSLSLHGSDIMLDIRSIIHDVPSLVQSVLGTQKQRSRFFWIRSMVAGASGVYVGHLITDAAGVAVRFAVAAPSFYTLAPVFALVVCFIEQMLY